SGRMNGAPVLGKGLKLTERRSRYVSWARVMEEEFKALQVAEKHGKRTLIDTYGAGEPAEFFAVVTEAFFERAKKLREDHPELYEELRVFYRQDPAGWGGLKS
ncbi:MAG: zinc-dependent peptidase, partial [Verrucomicrobiales bacterium]|nr:zinc-dependent peptidase [Verrucomicrobiales bacterium]